MKRSSKLLGIAFAIVLCSTAFGGVLSAPTAHAQSNAPAPGSGCSWRQLEGDTKYFTYQGNGSYQLYVFLDADYNTTTGYACHHMYVEGEVWTPAGGYGDTMWVYLRNCNGDLIQNASTPIQHAYGGAYTAVFTPSMTLDCGQGETVDTVGSTWIGDILTGYHHD